jgi:hypothetical protein
MCAASAVAGGSRSPTPVCFRAAASE